MATWVQKIKENQKIITTPENQREMTMDDVRRMNRYELKTFLGDFEEDYKKHCTGKFSYNEVVGFEYEGVITWLIQTGALALRDGRYYVKEPKFTSYNLKWNALREMNYRRKQAEEKSKESLNFITA